LFCRTWANAQLETLPCPSQTLLYPSILIQFPDKFSALLRFSIFNSITFPEAGRREQK